ncbi:Cytoplasmic glyoxalase II [Vanrija albida]|uniref:hydroxyacylglutathione hydrolase n=1 Tax=Vanrija albida TaxID=181172 RepID=A0ABR3QDW7_9TREE
MKVVPVQARSDNWMYIVVDEASGEAAVVDPYDAPKLAQAVKDEGVKVTTLITTHHHHDHSGGNLAFLDLHPGLKAVGGSNQGPGTNTIVKDGDEFKLGSLHVKALATPCHTQDSICFFVEDKAKGQRGVFTGDTLFLAGCGRFFEGNAAEMNAALSKLAKLPEDTLVYNGHEYTTGSAKFGLAIEPDNAALKGLFERSQTDKVTTGKSTIGDEKKWNVFIRLDTPEAKKATGETEPLKVLAKLRELKNAF